MAPTQMLSAVLQAFILNHLGDVASNYLHASAVAANIPHDPTTGKITGDLASKLNGTYHMKPENILNDTNRSKLWSVDWKGSMALVVMLMVDYQWNIMLERWFPRRRVPDGALRSGEYAPVQNDETTPEEERVVEKWIAAGKVRREGLSWWNTIVKWVLDSVVGNILLAFVWEVSLTTLKWKWNGTTMKQFAGAVLAAYLGVLSPVTTFIGMIVLPAHRRIVIKEVSGLLWKLLFGFLAHKYFAWGLGIDMVREGIMLDLATKANSSKAEVTQKLEL